MTPTPSIGEDAMGYLYEALIWERYCSKRLEFVVDWPGGGMAATAALVKLLDDAVTDQPLLDIPAPRLTRAGEDLADQMTTLEFSATYSCIIDEPDYVITPLWCQPRLSWLPYAANGCYVIEIHQLLYLTLCEVAPWCDLYEPPTPRFIQELRHLVGFPNIPYQPAPAVSHLLPKPPRRRLY